MGGVLAAGEAGEPGGAGAQGRRDRRRRVRAPPAPAATAQPPGFQACDAWQREAKEAKERALAADSARQLALQKKEEVEAQFRRLREELEGRGPGATLPGLPRSADLGATPLPKLHSLQTRLRLDLEAVDGVSLGATTLFLPRLPALPCAVRSHPPESPWHLGLFHAWCSLHSATDPFRARALC